MNWKKLSAFAPMLAVIVLAGCMGKTLAGYTPATYEAKAEEITLQEETTQSTEEKGQQTSKIKKKTKKASKTESKKKAAKGNFDLEDGTYIGEGQGFGGTIKVSVVIKDKTITEINVVSAEGEDAAFFGRAKGVIDKILSGQKTDVDVVSGATYSSRGIISAVKNALTGEKDTSTSPAAGGTGGASAAAGSGKITQVAEDKDQTCKDGTYYGTGTGFGGTVKVKVVIKDNKIKSIEIVEHQDGSSYMQKASALISTVIEKQSTNVDGVSGATYSSAGLIEAIRNAVDQAKTTKTTGDNKKETEKKNNDTSGTVTPQVTGKFPYKDGIYYGTGEGYMGDITVAVVIQNKTVTSILVTETDGDGEEFVKKAKAVADQIVKKQSTRKIDTVSGATYSSKGILEAIKDALNHAKEATNGKETEKPAETETQKPAETEKPSESESSSESEKERVYADGDYTASATCTSSGGGAFDDYTLTATVTIKDDKITAITNVAGSGAGYVAADALYIKRAAEGTRKAQGVVAQVLAKNSLDEIDVVSGATCSSNALLEACRQALESAKIVQQSE